MNMSLARCHQPEILLFSLSSTSMVDPLGAHVLFFALTDMATGCGLSIHELLCRNIDHLSKDLNLMLRQRQTSSPGLPTIIRNELHICESNFF